MFSPTFLPNRNLHRLILAAGLPVALVIILLSLLPGPAGASGVIYVDADASGGATGLSWTDAFTNVQNALVVAVSGDQVWVAEGIYYPDEGGGGPNNVPTATFTLTNGVALFGGFDGSEIQLGQRDPAVHVTVLSGDIDENDVTDPNGVVTDTANIVGVNAYHVVTGGGTGGSAVLDGFTITAGQANGSPVPNERGGGMYNDGSSPTLTDVIFSGNSASRGGAIYNDGSSPTLTDVTFSGNSAAPYQGGGMHNDGSSPTLTDVTFSGNSAVTGGGMYNTDGSNPTLTGVAFSSNSATNGGGMHSNNNSGPTLTDVTFSDNNAVNGGGMYNSFSNPTLTDVTFSSNDAVGGGGGGMANNSSNPTLTDVTFINSDALISGGGMSNNGSHPTLTDVTFSGNGANSGGGMGNVNGSDPTLTGVMFSGNSADVFSGGGMANNNSDPSLTNVTFSGNSAADNGGGMANANNSSATLTNVTFSGNSASDDGGGIYNSFSNPTLTNVILWGDTATTGPEIYNNSSTPGIAYSDIQGCGGSSSWDPACGTDNGDNIDANPLFVDPDGADDTLGTLDDDLRLSAGSPAIDAGDNSSCPPTDQRGTPRPSDGDLDGQAVCDIGAFEYQFPSSTAILSDLPDPSAAGEPFTVTVSVSSTLGTPTGAVTVTVSGEPQNCTAILAGGMGACSLTLSLPGTYTLTATYSGDSSFATSLDTQDHTVTLAPTTTSILSDKPDPSEPDEPFTVTVSVSSTLGTPTGAVTVTVSGEPQNCTTILAGGMGACSLTLSLPGTYTLTATYSGDSSFATSLDTQDHIVTLAPTTTSILSDEPDPSEPDEPFTVTVSVSSTLGTPTGAVTFTVSGEPESCSTMLVSGMGGCALVLLAPGTYTLTASYGGDGLYAPSNGIEAHIVRLVYRLYVPFVTR